MIIETKFGFQDVVYPICNERVPKWVPCEFCGGTGRITGANQKDRMCPDCYGKQGSTIYQATAWQVKQPLTIGHVRVEHTCKSKGYDPYSMSDNYGPQKENRVEQYMCYETGIGAGILYYADKLFATQEEAQAECDKRNSE